MHWVTFRKGDAAAQCGPDRVTWAHFPTTRNVRNALRNLGLAVRMLRRDRPDVIVSDGAGVAVPFFVAARLYRIPTVYLAVSYTHLDVYKRQVCARWSRWDRW